MNIVALFVVLSIINVIFSTIRSLITIKGGKVVASFVNGAYFAFYNIMLIYSVADFSLIQKCIITFVCNVFGVYFVKWIESKMAKDKVWKVECITDYNTAKKIIDKIEKEGAPCYNDFTVYDTSWHFDFICNTQKESKELKKLLDCFDNVKYVVFESNVTLQVVN